MELNMDENEFKTLRKLARDVQARAYADYSHFHIGAAIQLKNKRVFTGCNVENSSYGLTICAERNAIFHMCAETEPSERTLTTVVVCGEAHAEDLVTPCGACRQVIAEFVDPKEDCNVILVRPDNDQFKVLGLLKDLLPHAFLPRDIHFAHEQQNNASE